MRKKLAIRKKNRQTNILLVDENDSITGFGEKLEVHKQGLLHRAFSIFVLNAENYLLLQKRADTKYHSPGMWTNTCCSHQSMDEDNDEFIHTRLREEMGIDCQLTYLFKHTYRAEFPNNMIEHEIDYIYLGHYNGSPKPNPEEVSDWRWEHCDILYDDIVANPDQYSYWFKEIFPIFYKKIFQ